MTRYMLDTDVSSYLIRGDHPEILEQIRKHLDKQRGTFFKSQIEKEEKRL